MREKIGHYKIVSELGRGGMGIVYHGREEALDRSVAIKVLTERLTDDDTYLQRFVREARAAAGVSHPNIVQIYFIGEDENHPYFVMEYVTGRSLNKILREEGRIPNPRASQMILQAAHGLAAAHDRGIIHRDIKPANLILDDRGTVKIADFGLALPVAAETRLTGTGMLVGTPGYLAPEQCMGEPIDNRTDIYALGVTFYELLTGQPPFKGDSPLALLRQIMEEQPPDIGALAPDVDDETRRVLGKMLAKDRAQRYQSCHELVTELEDYLAARGVRSMTAGLATKVPSSVRPMAGSQDAPTAFTPAAAAVAAAAAPTAAATRPDLPLAAAVTAVGAMPAAGAVPPPAAAVPPAVAAPPRSSSSARALGIIAIVLALVVGSAIAAGVLVVNKYRSLTSTTDRPINTAAAIPQGKAAGTIATVTDDALLSSPAAPAPNAVPTADAQTSAPAPAPAVTPAQQPPRPAVTPKPVPAPAPTPAPKRRSGVGIAVTGDPNLIGTISSVLMSEFDAAGLQPVDAQTLPSTENMLRGGDASASRLIDRIADEGLAILVIARVDAAGERELRYMGRSDVAYSSRVTLTAYDLASGRPISGASRSATMEYTSRTTDRESEKVVAPLARQIARAIE